MSIRIRNISKRKRDSSRNPDLEEKAGGEGCYGLEEETNDRHQLQLQHSSFPPCGFYGKRPTAGSTALSMASRSKARRFRKSSASVASTLQNQKRSKNSNNIPTSSIRIRRPLTRGSMAASVKSSSNSCQVAAVHVVCAIAENLARETCVASLDAGSPVCLQVTKQGNGQTYAETLAYLEILRPDEILLNEGRRNSPLARKVLQLYSNTTDQQGEGKVAAASTAASTSTVVKFISRTCFDQTKGAEMLRRLTRKDTYDAALLEEFILLSSAHAVLHYTQRTLGASLSRNCLDINVNSGGKNRMAIDRSSLLQLELLTNAKSGKVKNSLISTIDCTKTTVGSRLLRTNLMAPPCRTDTINARLDLVDTFLGNEDFFYAVLEHLQNLPAVDKMLTNVAVVPRQSDQKKNKLAATARLASKGISALVYIKATLVAIPVLTQILKDHLAELEAREDAPAAGSGDMLQDDGVSKVTGRSSLLIGLGGGETSTVPPNRHHLLRAIIFAMSQPELADIRDSISAIFTDSTSFSRNANAMRHQECFALKSGEDGMMDILRKAFLANVDDIYKKADQYAEVHGFHVSVRYTTTRGYFLSIPGDVASSLPDLFIQPTLRGKYIHCTTEEINSLNIRSQDNVNDLILMTRDRIQEVLDVARDKYDALASLSDAVALLDLCHGFADKVTLCQEPWSRPTLHDGTEPEHSGVTIRNGRFGIDATDSFDDGSAGIIPNDTYATGIKNFTVISGINGSGKSTYLKQIAIIVLLAHCGGYVPAEYASIPIRSRLCVRMGTADDSENNISSFMLEMKETAFICNNASCGSLILLDELGRATSNEDGAAIAWAVSEYLLSKKSMTFFVSHYPELCRLEQVYPAVQNQHLKASVSTDDNNFSGISYTHKVSPGPCTVTTDYGVEMATACGWPADVVDNAREIELSLRGKLQDGVFGTDRQYGCGDDNNQAMSTLSGKGLLKGLTRALAKIVETEKSVASLQQALNVRTKMIKMELHKVPSDRGVSMPKEMLADLIRGSECKDGNMQLIGLTRSNASSTATDPMNEKAKDCSNRPDDASSISSLNSSSSSSSSEEEDDHSENA